MKYLYLMVNLGAVLIPFLFSFHKRIAFYKEFPTVLLSLLFVAVPFIAWDVYFTSLGVWGFNPYYLMGYYLNNIPVEEVMFFFFIPFSCLFTYFTLRKNLVKNFCLPGDQAIGIISGISFIAVAIWFRTLHYTCWTLILAGTALIVAALFMRRFFTSFLISYLVLLIPFFITNGILTGTGIDGEVVWYNNSENLGIRVLTIPLEDFFYGLLIILLNILTFEQLTAYFNRSHETAKA